MNSLIGWLSIQHVLVFVMQCIRQAFIRYLLTYWFKPKKYVPSTLLSLLFLPQIVGTIFTPFCWASPNEKGQVCNQTNVLETFFLFYPFCFRFFRQIGNHFFIHLCDHFCEFSHIINLPALLCSQIQKKCTLYSKLYTFGIEHLLILHGFLSWFYSKAKGI